MNKYIFFLFASITYSSCTQMIIPDSIIEQKNITQNNSENIISEESIKKEIDSIAKKLIDSKYNIGIVVAVLHNNKTNIYSYGHANISNKKEITENTIFGIGSNTKMLINSLALILQEKGLINLEETIGDILPKELNYKDEKVRNISLKSLALHSSGLPREPNDFKTTTTMLSYISTGKHIYRHIDKEYLYDYLENCTLKEKNESDAIYSNIGSGLFAHLLTIKTGKSLEELLEKYLFQVLNMNNTTLSLPVNKNLSTGYVGDFPPLMKKNQPLKNWIWSDVMLGTGGAYSTAGDLMQIAKAHLSLSNTELDNIFKQAHQIYTYDGELYYTLAWQVKKFKEFKTIIHYKYGVIAGFSCYVGINTKTNDAIIVLKNNFNWKDEIGHNILLRLDKSK